MKTTAHDTNIRKRLIAAFGVTEAKMFWLEVELGMRYLEYQCMGTQSAIDALKSEPAYWNWFIGQWYAANELFVSDYAACTSPTWGMYVAFHKEVMSGEMMCKSYMHYMGLITKTESRKAAKRFANHEQEMQVL